MSLHELLMEQARMQECSSKHSDDWSEGERVVEAKKLFAIRDEVLRIQAEQGLATLKELDSMEPSDDVNQYMMIGEATAVTYRSG